MIKINLLNSVTDRAGGSGDGDATIAAAVEKKAANPQSQMMIVLVSVLSIMTLVMGFDYWMTARNQAAAQAELEEQQRVAVEMKAILKEQADLEKQTKAISARIDAIKKLRSNQQGPVAVLSAINERIPALESFSLESIEQKEGNLSIKGDSPNEAAVTQFGRSLEFSTGLFTNVNIEIQRKDLPGFIPSGGTAAPKAETVGFIIKCRYTPPVATAASTVAGNTTVNPIASGSAAAATVVAPAAVPASAPAAPAPVAQ